MFFLIILKLGFKSTLQSEFHVKVQWTFAFSKSTPECANCLLQLLNLASQSNGVKGGSTRQFAWDSHEEIKLALWMDLWWNPVFIFIFVWAMKNIRPVHTFLFLSKLWLNFSHAAYWNLYLQIKSIVAKSCDFLLNDLFRRLMSSMYMLTFVCDVWRGQEDDNCC